MTKRCEFLEAQDKRKSQEISELRTFINTASERMAQIAELAYSVRGKVVMDAPTAADPQKVDGEPLSIGKEVHLVYPMKRVSGAVWMRYRSVDAKTAQVDWRWVMLFREHPDKEDEIYVTAFC